jgi:hypothetical protein
MTRERAREILEWMYRNGIEPEGVMGTKAMTESDTRRARESSPLPPERRTKQE